MNIFHFSITKRNIKLNNFSSFKRRYEQHAPHFLRENATFGGVEIRRAPIPHRGDIEIEADFRPTVERS